jgi:divalent metal cation (Fe/Co/Zn/Cd) transporter
MIIESAIGLLILATVVYLFWQSGKTNSNKLVDKVVAKVVEKAVSVVDVNKDGKVNVDDIKTVAKKVEDKVTTLVDEVKTKKSAKKVQPEVKPKRARNNGKLVADNPATPDVNEAWEGGKAPEKTTKPKKPKKPKMTVAK